MRFTIFGAWRSLVAHLLWEQGVGGSNPLAPTRCITVIENKIIYKRKPWKAVNGTGAPFKYYLRTH